MIKRLESGSEHEPWLDSSRENMAGKEDISYDYLGGYPMQGNNVSKAILREARI